MVRSVDWLDDFLYRPDEPTPALLEVLDPGPAVAPVPEEEEREYLAFHLAAETYAVPIERVREIVKMPVLTEVPRGGPALLGVMNLRGEVLPVYDVRARLKLIDRVSTVTGPSDVPRSARVVVLRDEQGDAGLLVDAVDDVVRLKVSLIEPAPPGSAESACVEGLSRLGDRLIILLDVERALP